MFIYLCHNVTRGKYRLVCDGNRTPFQRNVRKTCDICDTPWNIDLLSEINKYAYHDGRRMRANLRSGVAPQYRDIPAGR